MSARIVWAPIEGSSQELALDSRAHQTLYCGTRGPGKTDCQLMRFRRLVGVGYGKFWRGIIFDREYKNLGDVIAKSKRWFPEFKDGARFLESNSALKWVWPTGEELLFRTLKVPGDYNDYHGHEYPFIGFNELTKYPTSEMYDVIQSTNRSSFTPDKDGAHLPPIPLEVFSTTNPWGPGHAWVKRRFIDGTPYGKVTKREIEVTDPKTKRQIVVTKTQVAIFGSYVENIYLDPVYIATLTEDSDEARKAAWLTGSWDVIAGGALDDVWDAKKHVIPGKLVVPHSWKVDRSFDWGSTHPFGVVWWGESNGKTPADLTLRNGKKIEWLPPKGTLVALSEWYGSKEIGTNKGLKLSAKDIADGIRYRENMMRDAGTISGPIYAGPADNQIAAVTQIDVETIATKMAANGVHWTMSDKSKGSRKNGLQLVRDRLQASVRNDGPGLYFLDNCKACTSTIPILPRDEKEPDDIDTDSEDHLYDVVRYKVLQAANQAAGKIDMPMPC